MTVLVDLVLALFVLTGTIVLGLLGLRLIKSYNDSNKQDPQ